MRSLKELLAVLVGLGLWGLGGMAAPPLRALDLPMAHNLQAGQWEVRVFSLPPDPLTLLQFDFGINNQFQLGTRPLAAALGDLALLGQYHLGRADPLAVALPFALRVQLLDGSWSVQAGWVLGWSVLPWLTLHPGLLVRMHPGFDLLPYAVVHLHPGPTVHAWLSLRGPTLEVGFGGAFWLAPFLFIEAAWPGGSIPLRVTLAVRL